MEKWIRARGVSLLHRKENNWIINICKSKMELQINVQERRRNNNRRCRALETKIKRQNGLMANCVVLFCLYFVLSWIPVSDSINRFVILCSTLLFIVFLLFIIFETLIFHLIGTMCLSAWRQRNALDHEPLARGGCIDFVLPLRRTFRCFFSCKTTIIRMDITPSSPYTLPLQ